MPIPLPNLDDRSYADLTAEALALIPALDPAWTNHNPSDPGITLIELLAWLTEMLLFQVNQVTPASTENFLKLLNESGWARPDGVSLDAAIRQTIVGLRERYRAVTAADYEWLALNAWPESDAAGKLPGGGKLARVHCVPRRDLSATDPAARRAEAPAHLSLVVLAQPPPAPGAASDTALLGDLGKFLDERRMLTTLQHVVEPGYVAVEISANLALHEGAPPDTTLAAAHQALAAYYDPLKGGPQQQGWPFGRAVYASEASAVLEEVPLVDYVEDVQVTAPAAADKVQHDASGQAVTVVLDIDELVQLQATPLVAYDVYGQHFQEP
jgi:hypothetical protein